MRSYVILPSLVASASVLCAAVALRIRTDARVAALVRGLAAEPEPVIRLVPSALAAVAARMPRTFRRLDPRLIRLVVLAGTRWPAREVAALKLLLAVASAAAMTLMGAVSRPALVLLPVVAAAAYRTPDFVLARRARYRQAEIERRVPDLVELLVATTEAGLAPAVAFRRSTDVLGGPLGDELRLAVDEIDLGLPWRMAMDRLVARTDVPSLGRLVSALARSNRLGTSIRSTLRSVAGDLRADRRARADEAARRAPVKMLFPLVFLILPAFLLLTVGPVVLATVHSLRSG